MPLSPYFSLHPNWLIIGARQEATDMVMILASNELSFAEVVADTEMREVMVHGMPNPIWHQMEAVATRITFKTQMGSYTIVMASTFEEAMGKLLESWTPTDDRPGAGVRDLEPQRGLGPGGR